MAPVCDGSCWILFPVANVLWGKFSRTEDRRAIYITTAKPQEGWPGGGHWLQEAPYVHHVCGMSELCSHAPPPIHNTVYITWLPSVPAELHSTQQKLYPQSKQHRLTHSSHLRSTLLIRNRNIIVISLSITFPTWFPVDQLLNIFFTRLEKLLQFSETHVIIRYGAGGIIL